MKIKEKSKTAAAAAAAATAAAATAAGPSQDPPRTACFLIFSPSSPLRRILGWGEGIGPGRDLCAALRAFSHPLFCVENTLGLGFRF